MARVYVSSVINAPAAKVWARVRDFNGLPNWHPAHRREPDRERRAGRQGRLRPGFPRCATATGCAKSCSACPTSTCSAPTRSSNSPMPLTNYVATLRLTPGHRSGPHLHRMERPISTARRSGKRSWSAASAATCSRPASTRSTAPSEAERCRKVVRSTIIDAPVERLWAVLRDFNGHEPWHPIVATSHDRARLSRPTRSAASAASRCRTAPNCASNCWRCRIWK